MLALLDYEAQQCLCGGYLPETTDPANEGKYRTEPPLRCFRCEARMIRQAQYRDTTRPEALTVWPVWLPI